MAFLVAVHLIPCPVQTNHLQYKCEQQMKSSQALHKQSKSKDLPQGAPPLTHLDVLPQPVFFGSMNSEW